MGMSWWWVPRSATTARPTWSAASSGRSMPATARCSGPSIPYPTRPPTRLPRNGIPRRPPRLGAGNSWGLMSVDEDSGLVLVPTGSASPDFFGGTRLGSNRSRRLAPGAGCQERQAGLAPATRPSRSVGLRSRRSACVGDIDIQGVSGAGRHPRPPRPACSTCLIAARAGRSSRSTRNPVPPSFVAGEQASPTHPFSSIPSLVSQRPVDPRMPGASHSGTGASVATSSRRIVTREFSPLRILTEPFFRRATSAVSTGAVSSSTSSGSVSSRRESSADARNADSPGRAAGTDAVRQLSQLRVRETGGDALRHAPRAAAVPVGPAVYRPAVGYTCQRRLAPQSYSLAGASGIDRRCRTVVRADPRFRRCPIWAVPSAPRATWSSSGRPWTATFVPSTSRPGRELWKQRLPAGGQATPMTYRRGRSQRQFVVIAAGRTWRVSIQNAVTTSSPSHYRWRPGREVDARPVTTYVRGDLHGISDSIHRPAGGPHHSRHQDGQEPDLDLGAGIAVISWNHRVYRGGDHS